MSIRDSRRAEYRPSPSTEVDEGAGVVPESSAEADREWAGRVTGGIAAGSREALAKLYEAKFNLLLATVRDRIRCDESFALDCVQDAMIRIANSIERIDTTARLDAWLRRVVLSAALDRLRRERSEAARALRRGEWLDRVHVARDGAQENAEAAIEREIERLGQSDRSLLALRFVRGLTIQQLANHLGLAPKAIDSRLRRLIERLRAPREAAKDVAKGAARGGEP